MAAVTERDLYDAVLRGFQVCSLAIAGALLAVGSPYGSQTSYRGRLAVNGRAAWAAMELVSPAMLLYAYFGCPLWCGLAAVQPATAANGGSLWSARNVLAAAWAAHYAYRGVAYPLRQASRKPMHVGIVLAAVVFNTVNGYLNGRWLAAFAPAEHQQPLGRYVAAQWVRRGGGMSLFVAGAAGVVYHDAVLTGLRRDNSNSNNNSKGGYAVPHRGLFALVACPHYLCELVEWLGFALLSDSPAAWTFLLNAACNLLPRARLVHAWYRATFPDQYPESRRAIVPFLL
ncbi:hypothetical protein H4R18_000838 [Coemansia javaensis]|uniref:3-oxo-5-alpha-steroid 4-dehydrogenase C-terminal domain-containing protein n=1 Tax=Coemansia javaensis TaxID=2761396 RepID=A0A9W8HNB7_9FUNG|nr:hypothetical protein H4R18_000838 [Coemansia javaensis]